MKTVIFLIGIPGSGKTTYAKAHAYLHPGNTITIEKDDIRRELNGGSRDYTKSEERVKRIRKERIELFMKSPAAEHLVLSDTNLNPEDETNTREILDSTGVPYEFKAYYVDPGIDVSQERNEERWEAVPRKIVANMIRKYLQLRKGNQIKEISTPDLWYIGDIHSNDPTLVRMLEYLGKMGSPNVVFLGDVFDSRYDEGLGMSAYRTASATLETLRRYLSRNSNSLIIDSNHQFKLQRALTDSFIASNLPLDLQRTLTELAREDHIIFDQEREESTTIKTSFLSDIDYEALDFIFTAPYYSHHRYKGLNYIGVHAQYHSQLNQWRNTAKLRGIPLYGTTNSDGSRNKWWLKYAKLDPFITFGHYHTVEFGENYACIDACCGEEGGHLLGFNPITKEVIKVTDDADQPVQHCKLSEFIVEETPSKATS